MLKRLNNRYLTKDSSSRLLSLLHLSRLGLLLLLATHMDVRNLIHININIFIDNLAHFLLDQLLVFLILQYFAHLLTRLLYRLLHFPRLCFQVLHHLLVKILSSDNIGESTSSYFLVKLALLLRELILTRRCRRRGEENFAGINDSF